RRGFRRWGFGRFGSGWRGSGWLGGGDPPHRVCHIVGYDYRAARIDRHAHGAPARIAVVGKEAGREVDRLAIGLPVAERHENHLVADRRGAVPASMLADEHAVRELRAHGGGREGHAER